MSGPVLASSGIVAVAAVLVGIFFFFLFRPSGEDPNEQRDWLGFPHSLELTFERLPTSFSPRGTNGEKDLTESFFFYIGWGVVVLWSFFAALYLLVLGVSSTGVEESDENAFLNGALWILGSICLCLFWNPWIRSFSLCKMAVSTLVIFLGWVWAVVGQALTMPWMRGGWCGLTVGIAYGAVGGWTYVLFCLSLGAVLDAGSKSVGAERALIRGYDADELCWPASVVALGGSVVACIIADPGQIFPFFLLLCCYGDTSRNSIKFAIFVAGVGIVASTILVVLVSRQ